MKSLESLIVITSKQITFKITWKLYSDKTFEETKKKLKVSGETQSCG